MEYANDDITDIPEIDLNICVAVQPYQFEPLDRDSSSVSGSDSDRDSAESDEECSRPSIKSSKQIIVRCEKLIDPEILRAKNCKNCKNF